MNNWTEIEPPELKIQCNIVAQFCYISLLPMCKIPNLKSSVASINSLKKRWGWETKGYTLSVTKVGSKRFSSAYPLSVSDDMPYVGYSKSYVKTIKRKSVNASLKS